MNRPVTTLLIAAAALLGAPGWAAAEKPDIVTTRSGEIFEGKIVAEEIHGIRIVVKKGETAVRIAPDRIARVAHGAEPDLYTRAVEAMEQADFKTASNRFRRARMDRDPGGWIYDYATFLTARCYLFSGREEGSVERLMLARRFFREALVHNERTIFRPYVQHGLAAVYLAAADLAADGEARGAHLENARKQYQILLLNAQGGKFHYNAGDKSKRWEIRARVGLLACRARAGGAEFSKELPPLLQKLADEAKAKGLPDESGEAARVRLGYLLRHNRLSTAKAADAEIKTIDRHLSALGGTTGPMYGDRERLICRLHLLNARIHRVAARLDKKREAIHEKKSLLSVLRVAILYRKSIVARPEAAWAHLEAARRLVKAGRKEAAHKILAEMKERFARTRLWLKEGKPLYEKLTEKNSR